jgi:hypothetical protein
MDTTQNASNSRRLFDFTINFPVLMTALGMIVAAVLWVAVQGVGMQGQIRDTLNLVQNMQKQIDANKADADANKVHYAPIVESMQREQDVMNSRVQNMVASMQSMRDTITLGFTKSADQISELSKAQSTSHEAIAIMQMQLQHQNGPHGG